MPRANNRLNQILDLLEKFDVEHNVNNTRREASKLSELLEYDITVEYCDHYLRNITTYQQYQEAVINIISIYEDL